MNKLYITKVLPDGYATGVIPEMEMPIDDHDTVTFVYLRDRWNEHLASLPTFLVHPSLNPKEGEFIEQWREGWELDDGNFGWFACPEEVYEQALPKYRRKVILPLVEKKEESANFIQIVPDSHSWSSIEMLINWLKHQLVLDPNKPDLIYLIKGLENALANGYQLSQSPPSLQEREKEDAVYCKGFEEGMKRGKLYAATFSMKWVRASERLPVVLPEQKTIDRFIVDDRNEDGYGKVFLMSYHDLKDLAHYNKTIKWLDESEGTAKQSK